MSLVFITGSTVAWINAVWANLVQFGVYLVISRVGLLVVNVGIFFFLETLYIFLFVRMGISARSSETRIDRRRTFFKVPASATRSGRDGSAPKASISERVSPAYEIHELEFPG